jgi:hypothetical protein
LGRGGAIGAGYCSDERDRGEWKEEKEVDEIKDGEDEQKAESDWYDQAPLSPGIAYPSRKALGTSVRE